MNRNPMNNNFSPASLRRTGTARTVLLRMAADQERADRIRALKLARPDLTWRRIADHVGVSERAASDWQKKGGIEYANAKKLAALFEVDVDYVWRGTETDTPTPFAGPDATAEHLTRMEQRLADHAVAVERLIAQQNQLLQRQSRILERIEEAIAAEDESARRLAADGDAWADAVIARIQAQPSALQSPKRAPKAPAKSGTRKG